MRKRLIFSSSEAVIERVEVSVIEIVVGSRRFSEPIPTENVRRKVSGKTRPIYGRLH